jgi:peptidyl-Lys metalloendopeptidase
VRSLLLFVLITLGAPLHGDSFRDCTTAEARVLAQALDSAKALTVDAAAAVGDTREYGRWFGDYSVANAEYVRSNLKGIVAAIRRGTVTVECEQVEPDGCAAGEYAFVYTNRPYNLHICPSFFDLPTLSALRPGARQSDFGTREGTIVHELSHFEHVAGTEDHCYSRRECSAMAQEAPALAIENADSYQYFTEDVTYFSRQRVTGKPTPAPRPSR